MEEERAEEIDAKEKPEKKSYFFDTYAIIEILRGNTSYAKYTDLPATMSQWNLAEVYYNAILNLLLGDPDEIYNEYKSAVVEIDDETLKEAMKFRKQYKKQDVSYADAIGYIYAKRNKMIFLTGDKEFKELGNVEFTK
ncbi:MAG: PIN domain-containing protein [Nanoarchaeota archaeon]